MFSSHKGQGKPSDLLDSELIFFFFRVFNFVCVLPLFIYVYHMCAWCLQRAEEHAKSPGAGVTDDWEPQRGSWELNLSLLQEQ